MSWCGVIGDPVAHSLSPQLHLAAYDYLKLDWNYHKIAVKVGDLDTFLLNLEGSCCGLSVTRPHKQSLWGYLDYVDSLAKVVGAVNTMVPSPAGWAGFNTDVYGIIAALQRAAPVGKVKAAAILGGRASACSALAALTHLQISNISVHARTLGGPGTVGVACARMGITPALSPWRDLDKLAQGLRRELVISTLPDKVTDQLVDLIEPNRQQIFFDINYSQGRSPLAQKFIDSGATVVSALDMLVFQAWSQIKLFTSKEVPVELLFEAVN